MSVKTKSLDQQPSGWSSGDRRGLEDARRGNLPGYHLLAASDVHDNTRELRCSNFNNGNRCSLSAECISTSGIMSVKPKKAQARSRFRTEPRMPAMLVFASCSSIRRSTSR